jgi:hypothetical protein
LADPRVHQAEHLVGIQNQNHARSNLTETDCNLFRCARRASRRSDEFGQEARFRGFDVPAIESDDRSSCRSRALREHIEESRLAASCNTVQMHNQRPIRLQCLQKKSEFLRSSHKSVSHTAVD